MLVTKNLLYTHYIEIYNITNINFDNFSLYITNLYKKKQQFKIIFDLSNIQFTDLLYSKKLIDFMKLNKDNTFKYIIKTAIIVPNKNIELFINTFIFKFYKPQHPCIITYSLNNAIYFIK